MVLRDEEGYTSRILVTGSNPEGVDDSRNESELKDESKTLKVKVVDVILPRKARNALNKNNLYLKPTQVGR